MVVLGPNMAPAATKAPSPITAEGETIDRGCVTAMAMAPSATKSRWSSQRRELFPMATWIVVPRASSFGSLTRHPRTRQFQRRESLSSNVIEDPARPVARRASTTTAAWPPAPMITIECVIRIGVSSKLETLRRYRTCAGLRQTDYRNHHQQSHDNHSNDLRPLRTLPPTSLRPLAAVRYRSNFTIVRFRLKIGNRQR